MNYFDKDGNRGHPSPVKKKWTIVPPEIQNGLVRIGASLFKMRLKQAKEFNKPVWLN
jgi:hypothetical protein